MGILTAPKEALVAPRRRRMGDKRKRAVSPQRIAHGRPTCKQAFKVHCVDCTAALSADTSEVLLSTLHAS